ncbi:MAG: hypothetical protein OIF32_12590, partial [Campylobacterales bacterium]|nr:hypothetical protein [Campylobacterales bacterium]
MSLDICIEYKDKRKNYIEFSENLHNKIFIQNNFYSSLKSLRKIKDYYFCDENFKEKSLTEFISDLQIAQESLEDRDLKELLKKLTDKNIINL